MTEAVTPQTDATAEKPQLTINIPEVVNLACNILHGGFLAKGDEHGKKLFKQLKDEEKLAAGSMTVGEQVTIKLTISLDRKEFQGQLGFPVFKAILQAMLQNLGQALQARQDLNFLTGDNGNILVHKPGVIEKGGEYNVLVLVLAPSQNKEMNLCLTFLDPDQYEPLRKAKEKKSTASDK